MRQVPACMIVLSLLASACATPGPRTREIHFVQGCWVQQTSPGGEGASTLSLMPNEEDAVYAGDLDRTVSNGGHRSLSFSSDGTFAVMSATLVAADGSGGVVFGSHSFTRDTTAGPNDRARFHLAVFKSNNDAGGTLIVEARKDRLKISYGTVAQGPQHTMFDGKRSVCD